MPNILVKHAFTGSGGSRISKWERPRSSAACARIEARGTVWAGGFPPTGEGLFPPQKFFFEFRSQIFDLWYILGSVMTVKELYPGLLGYVLISYLAQVTKDFWWQRRGGHGPPRPLPESATVYWSTLCTAWGQLCYAEGVLCFVAETSALISWKQLASKRITPEFSSPVFT